MTELYSLSTDLIDFERHAKTRAQSNYDNNTTKCRNKKRNVADRSVPLFFLIVRIFHTERIPTEKTHTDIKYSNGIT